MQTHFGECSVCRSCFLPGHYANAALTKLFLKGRLLCLIPFLLCHGQNTPYFCVTIQLVSIQCRMVLTRRQYCLLILLCILSQHEGDLDQVEGKRNGKCQTQQALYNSKYGADCICLQACMHLAFRIEVLFTLQPGMHVLVVVMSRNCNMPGPSL